MAQRSDLFPPPTIQEVVLAELRREMLSGDLKPGEVINQEHVAARLGVSAIPVREALRMLEGQGLVVYRARRRYLVAELSVAGIQEVFLLRDQLEALAVTRGVPKADDDVLKRMEQAAHEFERAVKARQRDPERISVAHRDFMFAIFEASGMSTLLRILTNLWDMIDPYRALFVQRSLVTPPIRIELIEENQQLIDAVSQRDVKRVINIIKHHNERTHVAIIATLSDG